MRVIMIRVLLTVSTCHVTCACCDGFCCCCAAFSCSELFDSRVHFEGRKQSAKESDSGSGHVKEGPVHPEELPITPKVSRVIFRMAGDVRGVRDRLQVPARRGFQYKSRQGRSLGTLITSSCLRLRIPVRSCGCQCVASTLWRIGGEIVVGLLGTGHHECKNTGRRHV